MTLSDINDLDLKKLGTAPKPVQAIVCVLLCAALAGTGYWFHVRHHWAEYEETQAVEGELRAEFENKQQKAANLDLYKEQLDDMRRSFGAMLRQLPSQTEIPGLIVDISQTGLSSGLEIELFQPEAEIERDFYAEKPIRLRVKGTYHEFGEFASGVAALPRIVTLHNIKLTPGEEDSLMTLEATARTYRYLGDSEVEDDL